MRSRRSLAHIGEQRNAGAAALEYPASDVPAICTSNIANAKRATTRPAADARVVCRTRPARASRDTPIGTTIGSAYRVVTVS